MADLSARQEYHARLARAMQTMQSKGIDTLLIGPGSNLFYLTGIQTMSSERIYLLKLSADAAPQLILPTFERLAAEECGLDLEILEWDDANGPGAALLKLLPNRSSRIGVDDKLWSMFLLDLQSRVTQASWVAASSVMRELRMRKTAHELDMMREAAAIADRVFRELISQPFVGRRESDIAGEIQRLLIEGGQEKMQFGIVGSGPNGAKPHHEASERVIEAGESIVLDFGGTYRGYQSDMTRMVVTEGNTLDPDFYRVHEIVRRANEAAHAAVHIGATAASVDAAAREVITEAGFGEYFTHRTGHGIGVDIHEEPYITSTSLELLVESTTFSIEPGIYLPGRFGVRIEDIAICTAGGSENINRSSHDVAIVR